MPGTAAKFFFWLKELEMCFFMDDTGPKEF
jgi:hypothetical protein